MFVKIMFICVFFLQFYLTGCEVLVNMREIYIVYGGSIMNFNIVA